MPLFEKPAVVAFKSKLHGVVVNDTDRAGSGTPVIGGCRS